MLLLGWQPHICTQTVCNDNYITPMMMLAIGCMLPSVQFQNHNIKYITHHSTITIIPLTYTQHHTNQRSDHQHHNTDTQLENCNYVENIKLTKILLVVVGC